MTRCRAIVEDSSTSTSGLIHMHTHMPMYPNTYTHTMYTHMQYSTHTKKKEKWRVACQWGISQYCGFPEEALHLHSEKDQRNSLFGEQTIGTLCVVPQMLGRCGSQFFAWFSHDCLQHCSEQIQFHGTFLPFPFDLAKYI